MSKKTKNLEDLEDIMQIVFPADFESEVDKNDIIDTLIRNIDIIRARVCDESTAFPLSLSNLQKEVCVDGYWLQNHIFLVQKAEEFYF